jgi:signal transduction histidine kinase
MPRFAQFLRDRGADILGEWRTARQTPSHVLDQGATRTAIAAQWLEQLAAVAEGHSAATTRALLPNARGREAIAANTILGDLTLLNQVILRRAHAEHSNWGVQESELLWHAFEKALAGLTSAGAPVQQSASVGRRERFLGEASRVLAESLDYEHTLKTVARLAVPRMADWCSIDLLNSDGMVTRVTTEHSDPLQENLIRALHHNPPSHDAPAGAPNVIRTGVTEYVGVMSESVLQQRERSRERLSILRRLGLNSTICAPLVARDRIVGAITLCTSVGRDLTVDDVHMAEDLARRAAFAIDNARLYDEAQRAIHAREEILAIVTHDLRTPLSAVVAGASLLISTDSANPDGSRIKQRGETIQRSAQHMLRLVKDLTDLAQIDAGRLAIDRTLEHPATVVNEVLEALEPIVLRRGGTLRTRVNADVRPIPLDRDRVRQVLANLVGNASKVGASEISIGAELRGADVVFWVADNGPGISPEELPHMFDHYFRARGTQYKGSGLGLPISNGIVKAHGGRMWIESAVGAGSTFYLSMPLRAAPTVST